MSNKLYAGIGSRETPDYILDSMRKLAFILAKRGFILRSGGAPGADTAFEEGCKAGKGKAEIWLPWKNFNNRTDNRFLPTEKHYEVASKLHPIWKYLKRGPQALHSRNVGQILGMDINTPVGFVLCYTSDGVTNHEQVTEKTGGTGMAIKIASLNKIPVINMFHSDYLIKLKNVITNNM